MRVRHALALLFAAVASSTSAQTFEVVHTFQAGGTPLATLLDGGDGYFYGSTSQGGTRDLGTIFRTDAAGNFVTVHSFQGPEGAGPVGRLIRGSDGFFYGTTSNGGVSLYYGTVFRMDASGAVTVLYSFQFGADGASPAAGLVEGSDGFFYGTASIGGAPGSYGTIFRVSAAGEFGVLHAFVGTDGAYPLAELVFGLDGALYGTTQNGGTYGAGTVFRVDTSGNFTSFYSFTGNSEPASLQSPLLLASDGFFYGTAPAGGGHGAAFRMDTAGNVTTIHLFGFDDRGPQGSLVEAPDGFLYGTTAATFFRMDLSGGVTTVRTFTPDQGIQMRGVIRGHDGFFYATASSGGPGGRGALERLDDAGGLEILHAFAYTDGVRPYAGLLEGSDGFLYGTTATGGDHDLGTVFKMSASGRLATLHSFEAPGTYPGAPLVEGTDGALYGTTGIFGADGSVFRVTQTGSFSLLQTFPSTTLVSPLTPAFGLFYGVTQDGGSQRTGTIFRLGVDGGVKTLHQFTGDEGSAPGGLLLSSDGLLYGTTHFGGVGYGTLFSSTPAGAVSTLHEFSADEGGICDQPLIEASNGNLYGTCNVGGVGYGTVYRVDSGGAVGVVHTFLENEHAPIGPLFQASDGKLYGLTGDSAGPSFGSIFRLNPDGTGFETIHEFNPSTEGGTPQGGLMQAADGNIYGILSMGYGVVFRLVMASFAVTRIAPASGPAAGGIPLWIGGAGFAPGASVTIGGQAASDVQLLDSTLLQASAPPLAPGTLAEVTVGPSPAATLPGAYFVDFVDVAPGDAFHDAVEGLVRYGITAGCGGGNFCPAGTLSRSRAAVLLLRARNGAAYAPPPCVGLFSDVPCPGPFTDWVEALFLEGITGGCGGGRFCPDAELSRQQLAPLLLKSEHGPAYLPPSCVGRFEDAPCPGLFSDWIEALADERVTAGCLTSPPLFCPLGTVTRAQAAAFVVTAFKLP
jgi:uncharacterized repeat protein (TIGR03803 family)